MSFLSKVEATKVNAYDYAVMTVNTFLLMYPHDHFNRESFSKYVSESYKPKKKEFLVKLSKKEGVGSSGDQKNLRYWVGNTWVDRKSARQSLLPADVEVEQLEYMEQWVESYDKKALSKIKPLKDKNSIKEFLQKAERKGSDYLLYYGDRDYGYGSAKGGTIKFKYLTSLTPKKSIARGFGAPLADYRGKPIGQGNIHSIRIKPEDVYHIPSTWAKYSKIIKQYAKEQEVIVKPSEYKTIS